MTDQKSKLESIELTISIIRDLKSNVNEENFRSYLTDRINFFQVILDNAKREINYVIPRIVFIQAHIVIKSYEDAMRKMIEAYGNDNSTCAFYQYATAMILKSQLWMLYHEQRG